MRLIDADRIIYHEIDEIGGEYEPYLGCSKDQICNLPTVEAIPVTEKAFEMFETDYKNRLKADLKAILVELQLEIEETEVDVDYAQLYYCKIIQQKINELKEDQEGKNEISILKRT